MHVRSRDACTHGLLRTGAGNGAGAGAGAGTGEGTGSGTGKAVRSSMSAYCMGVYAAVKVVRATRVRVRDFFSASVYSECVIC